MSIVNNIALQLAQILNQQHHDSTMKGMIPVNTADNNNNSLLEQYTNLFPPYFSRVASEPILGNLCNQPSIVNSMTEQILAAYGGNSTFSVNTLTPYERNNSTPVSLAITTSETSNIVSPTNKSHEGVNSPVQSGVANIHTNPEVKTQQAVPLNMINATNMNNWVETTLSSLLDKPDILMNLMRLGAASIMASYYGQNQAPASTTCPLLHQSYMNNLLLSHSHSPCHVATPAEMSTSSSLAYTPIKSPIIESTENQSPIFASSTTNQQCSDELIFYNFLEQSRKLSCDMKGQCDKKVTATNKVNSSIRKSCAGRPRLDRSDWCCSLCRCIETAQWRYLRNTVEGNSTGHRGKVLVCNACYLRVSKENKIRQKVTTFQSNESIKLDEN
ncbi:hypothetical protein ACR3K2_06530 [Cryptosporidium serpentis]